MRKQINFLSRVIRWQSWSDTKLVFLFLSLGIIMLEKSIADPIIQLVILFRYAIFFVIYGAIVSIANDYWDLKIDMEAKKKRGVAFLPKKVIEMILPILFLIFLFLLFFITNLNTELILLGAAMILLGFFYSCPPFRLKEKGWLGVMVGSLIQRTLPLLFVFGAFRHLTLASISLIVLTFFLGIKIMLMHQIEDYYTDLKSKVATLTRVVGIRNAKKFIRILYVPEIIMLLSFVWLSQNLLGYLLTIFYFVGLALFLIAKPEIKNSIDVYSLNHFFLSDYYYVFLPLFIGALLFYYTGNPVLIFLFLFLQKKHVLILLNRIAGKS